MTAPFIVSIVALMLIKCMASLVMSSWFSWAAGLFACVYIFKKLDLSRLSSGDRRRRVIFPVEPRLEISSKRAVYVEDYILNSRQMLLHTQCWFPKVASSEEPDPKPKALVFYCHGYADDTNWLVRNTAREFVYNGYAFCTMDFEGHGKSDGLSCYVTNFSTLVRDYNDFACKIKAKYPSLPCILMGESMGGAVATRLSMEYPSLAVATVLVAPMCKISDSMMPHEFVIRCLRQVARVVPTLPIAPVPDVHEKCFSVAETKDFARRSPLLYHDKPRLATALQLLETSLYLTAHLDKVSFPFLVLHGREDTVTDPSCSQSLVAVSSTPDESKCLKLYADCGHALLQEPPARRQQVFLDLFAWIDQRLLLSSH